MFAVVAVLVTLLGTAFGTVRVMGHSMDPTLSEGDVLIASRLDYRLHPPQRGDIVILSGPQDPSRDFVKRIIGLPGDHVLIRAGHVYLDSRRLDEPYLARPWTLTIDWPAIPSSPDGEAVPPESYFVLGDNRDHSGDSRLFGYVSSQQILSRAVLRLLPPERFGGMTLRPVLAPRPAG